MVRPSHRRQGRGTSLQAMIEKFAGEIRQYTHAVNGRFIGGFITRNYGTMENVHAVQLELNRSTYMDEKTLQWDFEKSDQVLPVLERFILALINWATKRPAGLGS